MLHEEVVSRLRDMLLEGEVPPGARIPERELCLKLKISRTPLREALKVLAAEGLVELLPNRGAAVARMSEQDVADTFELIAGLEGLSGELAAQRITAAELAEIRALHYEMLAAYTRRDLPTYYSLNAVIHNHINAAARNPVLTETFQRLNQRIYATRYRSNLSNERWDKAIEEHAEILRLLEKRDGAGLRKLLTQHLLNKRDTIVTELKARQAEPPSTSAKAA